jgi:hypothetical protein
LPFDVRRSDAEHECLKPENSNPLRDFHLSFVEVWAKGFGVRGTRGVSTLTIADLLEHPVALDSKIMVRIAAAGAWRDASFKQLKLEIHDGLLGGKLSMRAPGNREMHYPNDRARDKVSLCSFPVGICSFARRSFLTVIAWLTQNSRAAREFIA